MISRREFIDRTSTLAAGMAFAASAKSYARILGANDRVRFAVAGVHGRGRAHLSALKANEKTAQLTHACDVDSSFLGKFVSSAQKELGYAPAADQDFRKALASKDVDAISIATPDHWHAPMAILALQAGKHVYVEKPSSYNPAEGEMLIAAQQKHGLQVQVGSQQRSSPHTIEIIGRIHAGLIGRAYFAKAWYVNNRKSIGIGKDGPAPPTLDWDLWQGPAPRRTYRDNVHPYNWHWFTAWGTGEALNNGTHEVDVCRWALDAGYPESCDAAGGRYQFQDDWQFYDTLVANWKYADKMISWEGHSCQPLRLYGRERGVVIEGTNGSVILDRDGYEVYDERGTRTSEFKANSTQTSSADTVGRDAMTDAHFANFIAAIQGKEPLRAPIAVANVAVTMMQLSNIAWATKRTLAVDPANGHILRDAQAEVMTRREYEKGWEPKV